MNSAETITALPPSASVSSPSPTRDELLAYCEWLFMEHRLLCLELWPDQNWREAHAQACDRVDASEPRYSPANTAGGDFHFPKDGRTWQDVPKPSTRCLEVFKAIGLDCSETAEASS